MLPFEPRAQQLPPWQARFLLWAASSQASSASSYSLQLPCFKGQKRVPSSSPAYHSSPIRGREVSRKRI